MPSERILEELENFGVEVETMGCVPPYANEKTYLFQCKNCKHEWFDYEDLEENYFEFTLNTYPGQYMGKIVYQEGFVCLQHSQYSEYLRIPNNEETKHFWKKIDELDVWSWKKKYSNDEILDGFGWEMIIKRNGKKEKKVYGYNSYPNNKKYFNKFLNSINKFVGWDFKI